MDARRAGLTARAVANFGLFFLGRPYFFFAGAGGGAF
jgi:hypothetical protein